MAKQGGSSLRVGDLLAGRYRVRSVLGFGALASAYRGEDLEAGGRAVALKLLEPRFLRTGLESSARFRRDAGRLLGFRHENVASLLGHGEVDEVPYLVTEFLDGESLAERMRRQGAPARPEDLDLRVAFCLQAARALQAAHAKGILHRDLRPANVLLAGSWPREDCESGDEPRVQVKVLDFCVARLFDFSRFLAARVVADTFHYMAPEQSGLLKQPVDQRADLYSLGVLAYELFCGSRPYEAEDPGAVLQQHLVLSPAPAHEVNPLVPQALSAVLERLMAKNPDDRYGSAEALAADLQGLRAPPSRQGLRAPLRPARVSVSGPGALPRRRVPLIERTAELQELRSALERARAAGGTMILVEGDAGIGKTRLLEDVRDSESENGPLFLYGKSEEFGSRIPYQPYRTALDPLAPALQAWSAEEREACRQRVRGLRPELGPFLGRMVPEVAGLLWSPAGAPDAEAPPASRDRVHESFCHLLGALGTRDRPLVLVLDDLQWAETETLDLLARHLDLLPSQCCVVAGLYRAEDVSRNQNLARLRDLVAARPDRARLLFPKALSPEGVRAFVRAALSESASGFQGLYKEMSRVSRGNPFILREALQALVDGDVLTQSPQDGTWSYEQARVHRSTISSNVIELILRRTQGLSPRAQHVLAVCSALRGNVSFERLLPLTGMEEDPLLDCLDEAARQQFIEEVPAGGDRIFYSFVHDKIREAVYNRTPAETRQEIHRRIAEHLEAVSGPGGGEAVFDLAHHHLEAGELSRALPWLVRAGESARAQNAHREAVRFYEEALKIQASERPVDPGEGSLHEKLGDLYAILGEYDRALASYGAIQPLPVEPLERAGWNRKLGTVFHKKGDTANAVRHLEQALAELGRRPSRGNVSTLASILGQVLLQAALRLFRPSRRAPGRKAGSKAQGRTVELARIYRELTYLYSFSDMFKAVQAHLFHFRFALRTGDASLVADAFRFHGIYLAQMRRFRKGRRFLERSLELYRSLGDEWGLANTVCYLAVWNLYRGDLCAARQGLEEGIAGLQKSEDRWELETAYVHLASVFWAQGENRKAVECFERVRRMATEGGDERGELSAHAGLGLSWGLLGEEEPAEAHFRLARRICLRSGHPFFLASYSWMYGVFCTTRGELDEGIRALRDSVRITGEKRLFSYYTILSFFLLSDACLRKAKAVPDGEERAAWLRAGRAALRKGRLAGVGFPLYRGRHRVLQGVYRSLRGRRRGAGIAFRKGIAMFRGLGADLLLAQALEEYAEHLARQGDLRSAEEPLRRAREIYRDKGLRLHYLRAGGAAETAPGAGSDPDRDAAHRPGLAPSISDEPILTPESRAFSTLLEASRLITGTLDLRQVLERIMDLSVHCLGAERGLLLLDEPDGSGLAPPEEAPRVPGLPLRRIAARNMDLDVPAAGRFEGVLPVIQQAVRTRRSVLVRDAREGPGPHDGPGGRPAPGTPLPRAALCVPMIHEDRLLGVLYLDNVSVARLFTSQDLEFLESLSSFAHIAIRNARAFEEAGRQRDEIRRLKDRLQEQIVHLKEEIGAEHHFEEMVGAGPAMQQVFRFIERAAPTEQPILIQGETGTGKELAARAVHRLSPRREGPFVKVNCAALPAGLLESELFGHEKGAFTGAIRRKLGRFELADGGTLFLDEIGELPPELQAKLLRVLQDMEFERIGGTRTLRVDVRVVAATNRLLPDEMKKGKFREDLYYRLNVLPVTLPTLRERTEDIPLLVSYFIDRLNKQLDKQVQGPDRETLERAARYPWPGNVRELENLIERAMVLSSGPTLNLAPYLFPDQAPGASRGVPDRSTPPAGLSVQTGDYYRAVEQFKRGVIQEALRRTGGSKKDAARLLGMAPSYLSRLLKNLGLKDEDDGDPSPQD